MRRLVPLAVLTFAIFIGSCEENQPLSMGKNAASIIGPVSIRIHPTFTQPKSWTGDEFF